MCHSIHSRMGILDDNVSCGSSRETASLAGLAGYRRKGDRLLDNMKHWTYALCVILFFDCDGYISQINETDRIIRATDKCAVFLAVPSGSDFFLYPSPARTGS